MSQTHDRPGRILVTDDDLEARRVLKAALESAGHAVIEAHDGEECLQTVVREQPDLVMCDLNMPGLSGMDVLRKIKSSEATRSIPFLLITGESDAMTRLEGIEAGAEDYINKPVEIAQLLARTKALLRAKRLDEEVRRQRRVIDNLLTISAFSPRYADASTRLYVDFTRRTAELLRARQVAIFIERRGMPMEIVSTWPVSEMRALSERLTRCEATRRVMTQADPVLIRADDFDGQHGCGLAEGFAGVPIFSLDGRPVGGVVAYGIPRDLRPESLQILMTLAQRTGSEIQMRDHSQHLEEVVRERTQDLQDALESLAGAKLALERSQEDVILRLATAAEFRDNETANHLRRLSQFSMMLAATLGIEGEEAAMLRYASLMHDIGKLGIPDEVLLKPGKLTDAEFEIMKTHTRLGATILSGSDSPMLQMSERVALTHHERWDGQGYPEGLGEADIPLEGRIVAVADIFDALTSRRVYKPAWPLAVAFDHLAELRGTHLDPELVDAFLSIRKDVTLIATELRDGEE